MLKETIKYKPRWIIHKYEDDAAYSSGDSYEEVVIDGNLLLNEGIAELMDLLIGGGGTTPFSNANARIGVGDSNTAEAAAQTDLQAAVNKTYGAMSATYPQRSGTTLTFRAAFGSAQANHAWNEFCVDNGAAAGKTLNRKVSAQGTKTAGQTWTVDLQITIA